MDRRLFLKRGGAVTATGLVGSCGQIAQKIIPYVVPPSDGVNPVEGWFFNTTCRMCEAGCGIMVRTVEGRAKKVEGNPIHPINNGGVCPRGQAAVQQLYHPERITGPLLRTGEKGSNEFKPVKWDEALAILAEKMKKAKEKGSFVMAADPNDLTSSIAYKVLNKLGSKDFVSPNMLGNETRIAASSIFAEQPPLPYYDISQAAFVLLLGADIHESGLSPTHYSWAYGEMRRGDPTHRGVLVYAGQRVSMTASVADRFIATKPGTLGILALGISSKILVVAEDEKLLPDVPRPTMAKWFENLKDYSVANTSKITGVPERDIEELAEKIITHFPSVVVPGDDVASHTNGVESLKAVEFLNMLLREIGRHKGSLKTHRLPYGEAGIYERMRKYLGVPARSRDFQTMQEVITKAANGNMGFGMILNVNPVHSLPATLQTGKALSMVDFLSVFSCFLDDTTAYADLVLPDNHFLESWSAQIPDYPYGVPILNAQQPVVNRLYDTMQAGDAILKAAVMAGINVGIDSQESMIKKLIGEFRAEWREVPPTYDEKQAWEFLLQRGGWWPESRPEEPMPKPSSDELWAVTNEFGIKKAVFSGEGDNTFYLHPYFTMNMGDGRNTNLPWLLEMPEPMTTLSWTSWMEINPVTAGKLGIDTGDVIKVTSPYGSIESPAFIYPGIGPDTVAIPFGWGHVSFGKYSSGRGSNAMALLGTPLVNGSGAPAWRGIKVELKKTGRKVKMVREAHPEGEYEGEVFQL
jgi:anaerobic selenocysteine-containing dehydrogenase